MYAVSNSIEMEQTKGKYHIVLVHGACHGAWCWYKLATLLKAHGHQVTTPDLAASGIDSTRVEDLKSFDEYSKPLYDIMESIPKGEKVVLVGHSLGGFSVAKAMEMFHDKIHVAFFVAAFLPHISQGFDHILEQFNKQEMSRNDMMDNKINFEGEDEAKVATYLFGPNFLASKLYQLCPPEDLMLATTLVRPTSNSLVEGENNTSFLTKERYGSVKTVYIVCQEDKIISKKFQHWMIQNYASHMAMLSGQNNVQEVVEIETDHMAMLSKPQELCQSLFQIIDNIK